jgi:hypothetical protein
MTSSAATTLAVGMLCAAAVMVWPGRKPVEARIRRLSRPRATTASAGWGGPGVPGVCDARAAVPPALPADVVMELVACGLRTGLAVGDALAAATPGARSEYLDAVVGRVRLGVPMEQAWARPPPEYEGLARAMVLAAMSGAPAAGVVAGAAADVRAARGERAELAAARLGVRLVLPLGLAVLPGFVLLAVVPIVLGLAGSVLDAGS